MLIMTEHIARFPIDGFLKKDSIVKVPVRKGSFTRALLRNKVGVRMLSDASSSDTSDFELSETAVIQYCSGYLIRSIKKGVLVETLAANFRKAIEVQARLGF